MSGDLRGDRGTEHTMDDGAMDFTMEELQEFLEGDRLDVRADPGFKERLRRKLWRMVSAKAGRAEDES